MSDPTEAARRQLLAESDSAPAGREALEAEHGEVYDTTEMTSAFEVVGFMAPFVVVRRRADGVKGSLQFQPSPRLYFGFVPDR